VAVIERLFDSRESVTSGQVARAAGVSRQAAHYHLKALERRGQVVHLGAGRGGHYRRVAQRVTTYPLAQLEEGDVWTLERSALKALDLPILDNPLVPRILDFTFTEMLNNAIDHSGGTEATVRWAFDPARIAFEIEDDGIGVFRNIQATRDLATEFDAVGELSKGKQTTDPVRHSGLGIYYSSRMVTRFVLSGGQLRWVVDNELEDNAIGWLDAPRVGTLVRCEIAHDTKTEPRRVFDALSVPEAPGYNKSTIRVSLFGEGHFVSRTEAKRLAAHLEDFRLVELDFTGIDEVGQGFVDELFRVWRRIHPGTELVPVNANPAIKAMIERTVGST